MIIKAVIYLIPSNASYYLTYIRLNYLDTLSLNISAIAISCQLLKGRMLAIG